MKNINKFMFACLMMTVASLSAFGGNRMGSDPDTYRPGKETQNYFIFTSDNLAPSAIAQAQVDATKVYGKYYPLLRQLSLRNIANDTTGDTFVCKFENVSVKVGTNPAPTGTMLIGTFTLPADAAFQKTTFSVYGNLIQ